MKIYQFVFLLFLTIPSSYSKESSDVQKDQNTSGLELFKKLLGNVHKSCYNWVTPLKIEKLHNPPFYELSKTLLKILSDQWKEENFRQYIQKTLIDQEGSHFFRMAYTSLPMLDDLVITFCLTALIMIGMILTIRIVPGIFELVSEYLSFIGNFRISTVIPVLFIYFLLASTIEFANSAQIAEDRLIIGHGWHHELTEYHNTYVTRKMSQFQCVFDAYWKVLTEFESWVNPYDFYKRILRNETGLFVEKKSLDQYLAETISDDKTREHVLNRITQRFVDEMHDYSSGPTVWRNRSRISDLKELLQSYYKKTLQLPEPGEYQAFKFSIIILSAYTLLIAIAVTILGFMDHKPWHDKILRILNWAQHGILVIIIIKVIIFVILVAQVCNTYKIQTTMNTGNFTFLNKTRTAHGIHLSFLFEKSYFAESTLPEVLGLPKHVYSSRPDRFQPDMTLRNLDFLKEHITNYTFRADLFFGRIAEHFGLNLKESPNYFSAIFFSLNFSRFTNSLMKDVTVPVSTPVWLIIVMPIYHFGIAFYVMFAIPKLRFDRKTWTNENLI